MRSSSYPVALWVLAAPFALAGCGAGLEVDVIAPSQGTLSETFSESARTALTHTHPIAMPFDGQLERPITLRPGDTVEPGQLLAPLDATAVSAAVGLSRARVKEGQAALKVKDDGRLEATGQQYVKQLQEATKQTVEASDAQVDANKARLKRAKEELARVAEQQKGGTASRKEFLDAQLQVELATIDLRRQETDRASNAAIHAAINLGPQWIADWLGRKRLERVEIVARIEQAQHDLRRAEHDLARAKVTAPVGGVVLQRHTDGVGPFRAGTLLVTLGRLDDLGVVAEVLTQDASRLALGGKVALSTGAVAAPLEGKVARIEPAGFTKRSSLGVEQQRVRVWIALDPRPAQLGVGYRLQATFEVASKAAALTVPRFSVLEAPDGTHYVFKVVDGRLQRQPVKLGLRGSARIEIREGLSAADKLVSAPDSTMQDGARVRVRP